MAVQSLTNVLTQVRTKLAAQHAALSDRDLLSRFVSDCDEGAVTTLVERHGAMILGICRRVLGNDHDAEDACQATFLVLVRKAGSVHKKESLASWLHGVAYHVATNLRRERSRRRHREEAVAASAQRVAPEDLTWREVQAVIDEELARLPERLRAPLVLCYLEGKTRDEAAKELHWPLATVRGRLERGRELLRSRLARRGLALSAVLTACQLGTAASTVLPPTLLSATIKAVLAIGNTTQAAAVPAPLAALLAGTLKAVLLKKLKIVVLLLIAIACSNVGLGMTVRGLPRADAVGALKQPAATNWLWPGAVGVAKVCQRLDSLAGHKQCITSFFLEVSHAKSVGYRVHRIVPRAWRCLCPG